MADAAEAKYTFPSDMMAVGSSPGIKLKQRRSFCGEYCDMR